MLKLEDIKSIYPFHPKTFILDSKEDIKMSYIDEGSGPVVLMLHGNPTWSFYYRNLIQKMKNTHRVIAPDHIGCGLSSKPQDYKYHLKNHIDNIDKL